MSGAFATPDNAAGLAALFARIPQTLERVILPINERAADKDSRLPAFYCVHSLSGAGGTDFQHLAKLMPGVRFFGIQAPPTKIRDPAFGASVGDIAAFYADTLLKFQPTGRFMLGGWSAGAIIGLEIAQILRARGRIVSLLVAIDMAPRNTAAALGRWHPLYLLEIVRNLPGWIHRDAVMMRRPIRLLIWRSLIKAVAQAKGALDPARAKQHNDLHALEEFMDMSDFRPDEKSFMERLYAAVLSYKPKSYGGDVVAYEAATKPLFNLPQVGRVWARLAVASSIVAVEGTHLSILRPGDVDALAADLRQRIADASEPVGEPSAMAPAATSHTASERKLA